MHCRDASAALRGSCRRGFRQDDLPHQGAGLGDVGARSKHAGEEAEVASRIPTLLPMKSWRTSTMTRWVHVSTIHSFYWSIAKTFQADIKVWLQNDIRRRISELEEEFENYSSRVRQTTRDRNKTDQERYARSLQALAGVRRSTTAWVATTPRAYSATRTSFSSPTSCCKNARCSDGSWR